jgi:hypothetical protein
MTMSNINLEMFVFLFLFLMVMGTNIMGSLSLSMIVNEPLVEIKSSNISGIKFIDIKSGDNFKLKCEGNQQIFWDPDDTYVNPYWVSMP